MEKRRRSVMMAINRTRRAWETYCRAVASELGIPESYRMIIFFLSRCPGANQKEIAEFANVTTAAVNQTLKDMIAGGYVRKETDENDRRHTRNYLTDKGEKTGLLLKEKLFAADEVIREAITPEKEEEIMGLLDKIHECIRRELSS